MSVVSRTATVERNLLDAVAGMASSEPRRPLDERLVPWSGLTARRAVGLLEAQFESRILDLLARELKNANQSYYTIGSSGHEGNAAVADVLRSDDMAFLHYRSGAFYCARAMNTPGAHGAFDVLLGLVASTDETIAGGRHKVFGSHALSIPPQTSTIASQLPKAVGYAMMLDRRARLESRSEDRIAVVTFGDASANHATAQAAFNTAGWATHQNVPVPLLFVCEDNGIGISVRTPEGWIGAQFRERAGLRYFHGDGLNLADAWRAAEEAQAWVRHHRRPAFLHLRTVRLMGHAGSDVEQVYRSAAEIADNERRDPLIVSARLLVEGGFLTPEAVADLWHRTRTRLRALADEALRRPKLETRAEVVGPLFRHRPEEVARAAATSARPEVRQEAFGSNLPEADSRPRHLAVQINRALLDLLLADDRTLLFGEDVALKGGVYHVTTELSKKIGVARVFNTLLDETSILGLAIGAAHAGCTPFPEIQYLAYLMNAIDQLRGEAGSMQFFSNGQFSNGMVVRIAGLAYQKGFGGHFHNDNGIAAVREIPGILVACPARPDDAVGMLRTLYGSAKHDGRVCVFLEPIALYMTKDLHEDGDGLWLAPYPAPGASIPVGEVGVHGQAEGPVDLTVVSYANGLWMSLRVARRLAAEGHRIRVIDLRWLHPLPVEALLPHVEAAGRVLVVDECRESSGVADTLLARLVERLGSDLELGRVVGADSYIPLAAAANLVLVQEPEIEAAARRLLVRPAAATAPSHRATAVVEST